jgi:hypothetical protein
MKAQYFGKKKKKGNLRRLYQIRPVSVAQARQEHLKLPSEHKFPFSSLRFIARKIPCKNSLTTYFD